MSVSPGHCLTPIRHLKLIPWHGGLLTQVNVDREELRTSMGILRAMRRMKGDMVVEYN